MAKERRDVWICDAPGCEVEIPADEDAPRGYSGVVSTEGGSGCLREPFFACNIGHLTEAIQAVEISAIERSWKR